MNSGGAGGAAFQGTQSRARGRPPRRGSALPSAGGSAGGRARPRRGRAHLRHRPHPSLSARAAPGAGGAGGEPPTCRAARGAAPEPRALLDPETPNFGGHTFFAARSPQNLSAKLKVSPKLAYGHFQPQPGQLRYLLFRHTPLFFFFFFL